MAEQAREIIDGLLLWWQRHHGMVQGARNANLYKLAAALNNFGVAFDDALSVCLRYEDPTSSDPFSATEITAVVKSAYRRTEHGVRRWESRRGAFCPSHPTMPRRVLSDAQTATIVDQLVVAIRKRWGASS